MGTTWPIQLLCPSENEEELRDIVLHGIKECGKSALFDSIQARLHGLQPPSSLSYNPTIGYRKGIIPKGKAFYTLNESVNIIDLGGGFDMPQYWRNFYKKVYAVFFVIDLSKDIEKQKDLLKICMKDLPEVPFAIIVNEQRLEEKSTLADMDIAERVLKANWSDIKDIRPDRYKYFLCDARTGFGVGYIFSWVDALYEHETMTHAETKDVENR